jgi:N-methylhydantoinase B/oxoprolinase/acetone carboxylase alpha subunit
MQEVYSIENVEEIVGYDEYIKDFEEQAAEYCKTSGTRLLQSVFSEFTADMECSVYLDYEQTKAEYPIRFEFNINVENGQIIVAYRGFS